MILRAGKALLTILNALKYLDIIMIYRVIKILALGVRCFLGFILFTYF